MDPTKSTKIITIKTNGTLKWIPIGSDAKKSVKDVQVALLRTMNSVQVAEATIWPVRGLFVQLVHLVARPSYLGEPVHDNSEKGSRCCLYHDLCGIYNFVYQPSGEIRHISGFSREVYFGFDCKIEIDLSYSTREEDNSVYPYLPMWSEVKSELGPLIEALESHRVGKNRSERDRRSSSRRSSSEPKSLFGPQWINLKKEK